MSTRATVRLESGNKSLYLYRHYDGYPQNVERDFASAFGQMENEEESTEWGFLMFINTHDYEPTNGFHSDESYKYYYMYDEENLEWKHIETISG
jgi:hypothetical protein